ncbi:tripartite tricarboxylate transporter substrate-binding protein [Egibacter rhizosphaerae]|uniref:tripartite tricarboxylate transporter substrate-binding protein n=1 Tax=Egibacter rhizosphaerae TaxID=1670831 RepID=UPI0013F16FEC
MVNREGSGGLVGNTWAAQEASEDGYDVLVSVNPFLFFDILINDGDFTPDDFEPLVWVGFDPILHIVRADSEIGEWDYEEILEHAEDNSSDIDVGVIPDNAFQFATIAIEDEREVQFNHVAFDGGAPGVEALLGGHIDMTNAFHAEVDQYLESGELRAVATTEPYEPLPDVPAFSEFGADLAHQTFGAARFVALPDEVDEEVSDYLHDLFLYILSTDEAEEAFDDAGLVLEPAPQAETVEVYDEAWETLSDMVEEME